MADIKQPDELVVTLRKAVTLGSETYAALQLREPTAGEMIQVDQLTGAASDVAIIALISGVPRPAVEKIGVRDLRIASRYIAGFFADAPTTGDDA